LRDSSSISRLLANPEIEKGEIRMKPTSTVACVFAGAILASTVATANSAPRHSARGTHYAYRHTAGLSTHHRAFRRGSIATVGVRRSHAVATRNHDERPSLAKAAIEGGFTSGIASVYSGGRTANGEVAAAGGLTAAHRSLPFGTMVKVTNRGTGRSVVVRINDRGPFVRGRVIDLTPAAARAIGFNGLAPVTLAVVSHS
jgi:peptidoglycan lytic transglycosylase